MDYHLNTPGVIWRVVKKMDVGETVQIMADGKRERMDVCAMLFKTRKSGRLGPDWDYITGKAPFGLSVTRTA